MRTSVRQPALRLLATIGLVAALLSPASIPASAATEDGLVLRVGTTQDMDSLNPYNAALVVSYEAFQLTYNLLVDFGPTLDPIPGFAESWERAEDGQSWTFRIRSGMEWSDGQPATSADACFSFQLTLDAIAAESNVGLGYIDPEIADIGVTGVECPDPETFIIHTDDATTRILQTYVPILPEHIWGDETYESMAEAVFEPPLVGTGPYLATEYRPGESVTFERNPSYWGEQGAADTVIIQSFDTSDTMVQALRRGELDYARGMSAEQFDSLASEPNLVTVAGKSNGWTELGFNTYGTGTGKTIDGGGPSTTALLDTAFRDAIGYAIDKQRLLDEIVGGYGDIGTTQVPPVLVDWHVPPSNVRTFDLDVARQKLETAGYLLDGQGRRLDKEGQPISLRLVMPDSDAEFPNIAQFVQDWLSELGIRVTSQVYDEGTLIDLMLPPEAGGAGNKADYDLFIWTWSGSPDPNALLGIFTCDAIGSSSDSNWCNETYDDLNQRQNAAASVSERKELLTEMQQLFYDEAPYHILYYDAELHAYRTDRFGGWQTIPEVGTPLFTYGTFDYTLLTDASLEPSPTPGAPSPGASPSASTPPGSTPPRGGGASPLPIIVAVGAVAVVIVGFLVYSRRRRVVDEDDE
jgi:peptide/nickel transport system substrate-binding protein